MESDQIIIDPAVSTVLEQLAAGNHEDIREITEEVGIHQQRIKDISRPLVERNLVSEGYTNGYLNLKISNENLDELKQTKKSIENQFSDLKKELNTKINDEIYKKIKQSSEEGSENLDIIEALNCSLDHIRDEEYSKLTRKMRDIHKKDYDGKELPGIEKFEQLRALNKTVMTIERVLTEIEN